MIAYIEGEIVDLSYSANQMYIIVRNACGVGYGVFVPSNSVLQLEEEVKLFTSLQVREDSQTLYGFLSLEQKEMFENVLNVTGIGPKIALSIVSNYSSPEFKEILYSGDYQTLSKVKGLGEKGAKKIVLELQGVYEQDFYTGGSVVEKELFDELNKALKSLGFRGEELKGLVQKGREEYKKVDGDMTVENLISIVLRNDQK